MDGKALEFEFQSEEEMHQRSDAFLERMRRRRSVRAFSDRPIPIEVVRRAIETATQAPSGAHKQPWTFVLITDPLTKQRIRENAEAEERDFYGHRAPERWLNDLEAFGTDEHKPFLERAPALIAVFAQRRGPTKNDHHYYVSESVGIAVGFLLAALHNAGLATLTHTPSPMAFLSEVLGRPEHERAFLLIPVGYPEEDCQVPDIMRKSLSEVLVEHHE
jgi:iodotyrosine deiodinase